MTESSRFGRSGIALFWMILAGVAVVQAAVSACAGPATLTPDWWPLVERQAPPYLLWALLTPGIIRLARAARGSLSRAVAVHIAAAIAVVILMGFSRAFFHDLTVHALHNGHQIGEWLAGGFLRLFELDLFIYAAIVAGVTGFDGYREAQARRRHEETLTMQLAQARLQALQMQMQPHFLFNTLNTVSALVERDPAQTRRVVARLSELLRRVMEGAEEQESTLAAELHFVRAYLEIEQVRFGDRLEFSFDVEPRLESARVPTLVLQPLVENAIRHGIAPCPWKGRVEVKAFGRGERLVLQVRDTGPGPLERVSSPGNGLALQNTRKRLEELYGGAAVLTLEPASDGGCIAEIALPLALAAALPKAG